MAFTKKPEMKWYRAMTNLSVGRVERGPNGREERAERVARGDKVQLTDEEAENFGRLVRPVDGEETDKVPTRVSPAQLFGIREVDKRGAVEQAGALDMTDKTTFIPGEATEAETDEEAQPYNNPTEPSYRGNKDK